ncbi:hypothetical protein LSAT2_031127 [Lamellibrachia satsuma]|nr:hypothetical protein LSAT2_031127 [Lamellibrachia satsuma]
MYGSLPTLARRRHLCDMHRRVATSALTSRACQPPPPMLKMAAAASSVLRPYDISASRTATFSRSSTSMCARCSSSDDDSSGYDNNDDKATSVCRKMRSTQADTQYCLNRSLNNSMGGKSPMPRCHESTQLVERLPVSNTRPAEPLNPDVRDHEARKTPTSFRRPYIPRRDNTPTTSSRQPPKKSSRRGNVSRNNSTVLKKCRGKKAKSKSQKSARHCSGSSRKRRQAKKPTPCWSPVPPPHQRKVPLKELKVAHKMLAKNANALGMSVANHRCCTPCPPSCPQCPPCCPPGSPKCPPRPDLSPPCCGCVPPQCCMRPCCPPDGACCKQDCFISKATLGKIALAEANAITCAVRNDGDDDDGDDDPPTPTGCFQKTQQSRKAKVDDDDSDEDDDWDLAYLQPPASGRGDLPPKSKLVWMKTFPRDSGRYAT